MMNNKRLLGSMLLVPLFTALLSSQEARRVLMTRQQPLLTYLKADDRHVVIESTRPRPQTLGPAPGETRAHLLGSAFDLVLGIHVQNVRGMPMKWMETPPAAPEFKTWLVPVPEDQADRIGSTVTARVEAVVKGSRGIDVGALINFQEECGAALIRGITVEYRIPWLRPLVAGRRYLFFANFAEDGGLVGRLAYEEIKPGTVLVRTYLDADVRPSDEFEQLTLDSALFRVKSELGL